MSGRAQRPSPREPGGVAPLRGQEGMKPSVKGFTLVELLVVVAIIALLVAILIPSLSAARDISRGALCSTRLRNLGYGFLIYAQRNNDLMLPGRFASGSPGGDVYWIGSGWKFCPRWVAAMGYEVGVVPFSKPSAVKANGGDRQDYDNEAYLDPAAPGMNDERNYAYGYNLQFLGNARKRADGRYRNWPVPIDRVRTASGTVVGCDSLGTAAAYAEKDRLPYTNNGSDFAALVNHAWSLDPPRRA